MAISCDSSVDEYYTTKRVFEFTSGSAGKKRLVTAMLICSDALIKKDVEEIACRFWLNILITRKI